MPTLNVEGFGTYEVDEGARLVNALTDNGVDILHRCGGNAKCTTCRVEFSAGEPEVYTKAEHAKLVDKGLLGQARLSCQIICDRDMALRPLQVFSESGLSDPGPPTEPTVTPAAEWFPERDFQDQA